MRKLLEIKNLCIDYKTDDGIVHAVKDLNLSIVNGQTLGFVGETGAGKTTTALGVLGLIPKPPGKIVSGEILYNGEDLLKKTPKQMRKILGKDIAMIFQDPMTSLNPVVTVKKQIAEMIYIHKKVSKKQAEEMALDMLETVGIKRERGDDYPHQFSGGMKQRVVIAIALACDPKLIIADEPTTALDVTIQAQVMELMLSLRDKFGTSMILITHDLGVVAEICEQVAIMYAGSVLENASKEQLYKNPKHPYTIGLFNSIPDINNDEDWLKEIEGLPPNPTEKHIGCSFEPRCPSRMEKCKTCKPALTEIEKGHYIKCFLYSNAEEGHIE